MLPPKQNVLHWTLHARAKMDYYRLSPARVRRVLNTPQRVEEGVAPKTMAMMQPASLKARTTGKETWSQEIWVMVEDKKKERTVISAWRYPGVTKPRDSVSAAFLQKEYKEYLKK
jgi:hypothetical protein